MTDPKNKPKKKVRREIAHYYRHFGAFLRKTEEYTRGKFQRIRPDDDIPDFQEFDDDEGIEVLLDIFNCLPTKFQDRDEIRWFLASRWKGEVSELHIFVIAAGVWKFILRHCKDVESNDGQAEEIEQEIQDSLSEVPATTNESEDLEVRKEEAKKGTSGATTLKEPPKTPLQPAQPITVKHAAGIVRKECGVSCSEKTILRWAKHYHAFPGKFSERGRLISIESETRFTNWLEEFKVSKEGIKKLKRHKKL